MSQALTRLRKVAATIFLSYWAFSGVLGTLWIVDAVIQRSARTERHVFARLMLQTYRQGHRVEICPDACFTQDHLKYQGIQILPTPEDEQAIKKE
jgi:hypothetical protein